MKKAEEKGKVWLAGAGPGDSGLLTVKTKVLIEEADVIVYDALVSMEILCQIPADKELVDVGKRAGNHPVPQEEINQILLRAAQQGKKVLRLKGGDPFVFGRGGEELELLAANGIPFEIVPGITSAVAAPAYGGIPVTHRDFNSSFHVITGHPRKDGANRIDFEALIRMEGTLIFLMGLGAIDFICQGLLEAGIDKDMPAAVVERGTTSMQRQVVSTVSQLAAAVEEKGIKAPAIILVGKVCSLADDFNWMGKRPLAGRQILLTRPKQNISKLAGELRKKGAQVIEMPTIVTEPIVPNEPLKAALEVFGCRDREEWLVFTSPIGVEVFFEQLQQMRFDVRQLMKGTKEVKIAAIGSATAKRLAGYGLLADLVPDTYCAKHLGAELADATGADSAVTIVRAEKGSEELLPPLQKKGIKVEDIALYRTVYQAHEDIADKIKKMFLEGEIDAVTFTSASTVQGFAGTINDIDYSQIQAVCIGEQTAAEAAKYNMKIQIAKEATIDSMIGLIEDMYSR